MAKLIAPFKLQGSVGDLTFYAGEDGETLVKSKSSPREWEMKHGERFQRSRLCNAEWQVATAATKTFRLAMCDLKSGVEERRLAGRMNGWLLQAIRSDVQHDWGERQLLSGDLSVLEGFEFNRKMPLDNLMPFNLDDRLQVGDGEAHVELPGFRLRRADKNVPTAATHFRVVSALLYVDFKQKKYSRAMHAGELTAIGRKSGKAFIAEHGVSLAPGQVGFWLLGIEFFMMQEGRLIPVKGGALKVMKVWPPIASAERVTLSEGTGQDDEQAVSEKCSKPYWTSASSLSMSVKATYFTTSKSPGFQLPLKAGSSGPYMRI
ncbi:hypothetical protein [Paraflavitalea pollutisoli]|uniref:hypothetical protein n=1 Tax=Paraflavitalea pollutisoli TaxID=3034143 RepID=UPI0023EB0492|nr:hypothetical protein [Paraflavitalea sp. H1-2-19X]